MDTQELIKSVDEITKAAATCSGERELRACRLRFASSHKQFAATYPKLFLMCFDQRFEQEQFRFLVSQLEQVRDKASFEASTSNVTNHMNDKYITPFVGAPHKDVDTTGMEHIKFTTSTGGAGSST